MKYFLLCLVAWVSFCVPFSFATDFYVDPSKGSDSNDGSRQHPWKNLNEVIESRVATQDWDVLPYRKATRLIAKNSEGKIKGGDTIWLNSGDYGDLRITGMYNSKPIRIFASAGAKPRFHSMVIRSAAHWELKGLFISPVFGSGKKPSTLAVIMCHGHTGPTHDITLEDCTIFSVWDSSDWNKTDWNSLVCSGIQAEGNKITIRHNYLKNVNFGITVGATHALIEHNTIENFAGDGMRGLGDYSVFQYNTVKNCYDVNGNHDDGFQSWTRSKDGKVAKGRIVGVVLRGNRFINFEDVNQPFRGTLQGIGCFGGMYVDWVIENNIVIVDHWHGITLMGAKGCRIMNNTLLDAKPGIPGPPWIRIDNRQDGKLSTDCIVRNNLAPSLHIVANKNMTVDHNLTFKNPYKIFRNPAQQDVHLRTDSPAIDAGVASDAPHKDIDGHPRPQTGKIDIGAYESATDTPNAPKK